MKTLYEVRGYDRDEKRIWERYVSAATPQAAERIAFTSATCPRKVCRVRAVAFGPGVPAFDLMRREGWIREVEPCGS